MKLWSLYITQNVYHGFFQFIAIICFTFYNKRDKKTEHDRKRININTFSVPQIFVNPSSSQPLSINPSFFVCFVTHGRKYQLSNPSTSQPLFAKLPYFRLLILIGLSNYGILLVNLCLKVAFPVSMFLKTLKQTLRSILRTTFDMALGHL